MRDGAMKKLRAVVLATVILGSLLGATMGSATAATGNGPTATITSVDKDIVASAGNVVVNYDATDSNSVDSATLQFIDKDDGSITKSVDVASGSGASETVQAPAANGSYNVQLTVTDSDGNTATSNTVALDVDTESPTVEITEPTDGVQTTGTPTLAANATDNVDISTVEFKIQAANGSNYTGSGWSTSEQWVTATENGDVWEYTAPEANGTYSVAVRATDGVGYTTNSEQSTDSSQPVPYNDGTVNYTLDLEAPDVTIDDVSHPGGKITVGNEVTINVTATDATTGVESVTVDASAFGKSDSLALNNTSGDAYNVTFTVDSLTVSDGGYGIDVTATDGVDQSETATSSNVTIDTAATSVGSVSIDADFVGVVEDKQIRVTASDIRDGNDNLVTVGEVNISIDGQSPFASVPVESDGSINTTIDPTELANDTASVGGSVDVTITGTSGASNTTTLVDEVQTMDSGWHLGGTPKPATDVLLSGEGSVIAYNQTDPDNWTQVGSSYMAQAGAGYFFNITSDQARAGYVFSDSATTQTWELDKGSHLVGVVSDDGAGEENATLNDLKNHTNDQERNDLEKVNFHIPENPHSSGDPTFVSGSGNGDTKLPAFSAYYIEVTNSRTDPVTYVVGLSTYNPL